ATKRVAGVFKWLACGFKCPAQFSKTRTILSIHRPVSMMLNAVLIQMLPLRVILPPLLKITFTFLNIYLIVM
ncbi:hypothetical protein L9F63_015766, partial [Diploptera punctata]